MRLNTSSASKEDERRVAEAIQFSFLQWPSVSHDRGAQRAGVRRPPIPSDEGGRRTEALDICRQLERDLIFRDQEQRVRVPRNSLPLDWESQRAEALWQLQNLSVSSDDESQRADRAAQRRQRGSGSSRRPRGSSPPSPAKGTGNPHKATCRCLACCPKAYIDGNLKNPWLESCALGCLCPRCLWSEQSAPALLFCQNQGHILPPVQQCNRPECTCKVGCLDVDCIRCILTPLQARENLEPRRVSRSRRRRRPARKDPKTERLRKIPE